MTESRLFIDTTIVAYALDRRDEGQQARAQELIHAYSDEIVVSTQVLIELYAASTRKLAMGHSVARSAVEAIGTVPVVDTDRGLVLYALQLSESAQLSIFDALIVGAAQRAGCDRLLTEDLSDQQKFDGVTIVNPFLA